MAIKSSTFGPVVLTGEDAKAFKEQIKNPDPVTLQRAARLVLEAREMAREMVEEGYVTIKPRSAPEP